MAELERRYPGSVRLFAPSETQAASAQLGSRRFKTDDRDCAALVWLAPPRCRPPGGRQARGRPAWRRSVTDVAWSPTAEVAPAAAPRPAPRAVPGPVRPGRPRPRPGPATSADRSGRPGVCGRLRWPAAHRAVVGGPGATVGSPRPPPSSGSSAGGGCLPPPADAELRAHAPGPRPCPPPALQADITAVEGEISVLLAGTDGQVLTTLPGVATVRAAAFAAHSLPIDRFPTPEHLYAATGLAPAAWQSASAQAPRPRSRRQGLPEHRDALMGIAWGLSHYSPSFHRARPRAARPRDATRSRPASRWPATPAGSAYAPLKDPATLRRSALSFGPAQSRAVTAKFAMPLRRRNASLPPARAGPPLTAHTKACRARRRLISLPHPRPSRADNPPLRRTSGRHRRPTSPCPPSPLTPQARASPARRCVHLLKTCGDRLPKVQETLRRAGIELPEAWEPLVSGAASTSPSSDREPPGDGRGRGA